jgi:biotin synthase
MEGRGVDGDGALEVLSLARRDLQAVLAWSDRIRRRHRGDAVRACGIVAAKVGLCSEDCAWCSQSARHATGVRAHGLLESGELLARARASAASGAASFGFVASGARPTASELDRLCRCLAVLAGEGAVEPCVSIGMLSEAEACRLAACGCRRVNHNLETSRRHWPNVVTTHAYDDRVATARAVKAAGMELCSGGLFGLGEGDADRVELALELRTLGADTVPVNFLNPIAGTPAAANAPLAPLECLGIIAMLRFVLPQVCIKVAGGRETALRDLQSWMFAAGADGFILGDYLTTCGRAPADDLQMVADVGLRIAGPGSAGAAPPGSTCSLHGHAV